MSRQPESESDLLLYVLTARGTMAWAKFKEVFEILYLRLVRSGAAASGDARRARSQTRRALDALGHCDFSFSSGPGRVSVASPVLARLPRAGLPEAVLAGARAPETIDRLRQAASDRGVAVGVEPQEPGLVLVPARVWARAGNVEDLATLAGDVAVEFAAGPPAWALLHAGGSLDAELAACHWQPEVALTWRRREFDPQSLEFVADGPSRGAARLASYLDPRRQTLRHYLYLAGRQALVDRDWGRYAVLREMNLNVLAYDRRQFLMAIPEGAPLPRLLARSLALCSGFAPSPLPAERAAWRSPERRRFHVYRSIPPAIAGEVAARLGQTLTQQSIAT